MDSFNFDLDFLNDIHFAPQSCISTAVETEQIKKDEEEATVKCEFRNINSFDVKELTSKLTEHNEMVKEISRLKEANERLKKQSASINESAENVRILFQNERKLVEELKTKNQRLYEELNLCNERVENLQQSLENTKYIQEQNKAFLEEKCKNLNDLVLSLIDFSFDAARQLSDNLILSTKTKKELMIIKSNLLKQNYEIPSVKNLHAKQKNVKLKSTMRSEEFNEIKTSNTSQINIDKLDKSTQYISSTVTRAVNTDFKVTTFDANVNISETADSKISFDEHIKYKTNSCFSPHHTFNKTHEEGFCDENAKEKLSDAQKIYPTIVLWKALGDNIFNLIKHGDNSLYESVNSRETILQKVLESQKSKEEDVSKLFYLNKESAMTSPTSDYSETQLSGDSIDDLAHVKPEMFCKETEIKKKRFDNFLSLKNETKNRQTKCCGEEKLKNISANLCNNTNDVKSIEIFDIGSKKNFSSCKSFFEIDEECEIDKHIICNNELKVNKDLVEFIPNAKRLTYTLSDSSDGDDCSVNIMKDQKDCKTTNFLKENPYRDKVEMQKMCPSTKLNISTNNISLKTASSGTEIHENFQSNAKRLEKNICGVNDTDTNSFTIFKSIEENSKCIFTNAKNLNNHNNLTLTIGIANELSEKISKTCKETPEVSEDSEKEPKNFQVNKAKSPISETKKLKNIEVKSEIETSYQYKCDKTPYSPLSDSGTSDSSLDSEGSSSLESETLESAESDSTNETESESSSSDSPKNSSLQFQVQNSTHDLFMKNETNWERCKKVKNLDESTPQPKKMESLFEDLFGDSFDNSPAHKTSSLTKQICEEKNLRERKHACTLQDDLFLSSSDDESCESDSDDKKKSVPQNENLNECTNSCKKIEESVLDEALYVGNSTSKICGKVIKNDSPKLNNTIHNEKDEIISNNGEENISIKKQDLHVVDKVNESILLSTKRTDIDEISKNQITSRLKICLENNVSNLENGSNPLVISDLHLFEDSSYIHKSPAYAEENGKTVNKNLISQNNYVDKEQSNNISIQHEQLKAVVENKRQESKCNEIIKIANDKLSNMSTSNAVDEILKLFPQIDRAKKTRTTRLLKQTVTLTKMTSLSTTHNKEQVAENCMFSNIKVKNSNENPKNCAKSYMCLRSAKNKSYKRKITENFADCSKKVKEDIGDLLLAETYAKSNETGITVSTKSSKTNCHVTDNNNHNKSMRDSSKTDFFDNIPNLDSITPIKEYSFASQDLTESTEKLIEECLENDNIKYFNPSKINLAKECTFDTKIAKIGAEFEEFDINKNFFEENGINLNDEKQNFKTVCPKEIKQPTPDNQNKLDSQLNKELLTSSFEYSPASPTWKFQESKNVSPVLIPLERRKFQSSGNKVGDNFTAIEKQESLIQYFLKIFDSHKQSKIFQNKVKNYTEILLKLKNILEHYVESPANEDQVKRCIYRLFQNTQNSKIICKAIAEIIEISKDKKKINSSLSLSISETEAKIVVLIEKFNTHIKQFKQNVITEIHNRVFKLKSDVIPLENLINLVKFNIILMDLENSLDKQSEDDRKMARLLTFKCLYYYNIKAIPMVFQLLISYPSILPRKSNPFYKDDDVIIKTIQSILNSIPYDVNKTDLKHYEMFYLLKDFYNYDRVKPSREELVEFLIINIRKHLLKDISYSFALICKQHGFEWTENFVIEKNILPLLNEYYAKILESEENDERIECLIESLSFIIKSFPVDFNNFDKYLQIFTNFLHSTARKRIQQAAVCALLRLSRFGLVNIFTAILNWCPNFEVDRTVKLMIQTFLYRKPLYYWKKIQNQIKE
ncbi:uncharacterized protein LOC129610939 [Condylostylus longicornis]|uniref:uncharacterized protein LOC129610939 n=1 Tax=Condylostylus longicornis TaxID=2530218 RepID=UPI00244DE1AD|nr:uncharacterized protein LOC129610939 [Condylostylus longicornis]